MADFNSERHYIKKYKVTAQDNNDVKVLEQEVAPIRHNEEHKYLISHTTLSPYVSPFVYMMEIRTASTNMTQYPTYTPPLIAYQDKYVTSKWWDGVVGNSLVSRTLNTNNYECMLWIHHQFTYTLDYRAATCSVFLDSVEYAPHIHLDETSTASIRSSEVQFAYTPAKVGTTFFQLSLTQHTSATLPSHKCRIQFFFF